MNNIESAFYSTTLRAKCEWLRDNVGLSVDRQALADAISDGCGGCESLAYGGEQDWTLVSVLYSDGGLRGGWSWYVGIDAQGGAIARVEVICRRTPANIAEDSLEQYVGLIGAYGDWQEVGELCEENGWIPADGFEPEEFEEEGDDLAAWLAERDAEGDVVDVVDLRAIA